MKLTDLQEFSKEKKKEHRMKIDKIKEASRQYNHDKQEKKIYKVLMEKYRYDEPYLVE